MAQGAEHAWRNKHGRPTAPTAGKSGKPLEATAARQVGRQPHHRHQHHAGRPAGRPPAVRAMS
jgi:hypothetical protein